MCSNGLTLTKLAVTDDDDDDDDDNGGGPRICNSLPVDITSARSLSVFLPPSTEDSNVSTVLPTHCTSRLVYSGFSTFFFA